MYDSKLIVDYGQLAPVNSVPDETFLIKKYIPQGQGQTQVEADAAAAAGFTEYINNTADHQMSAGLGFGSDFSKSMEKFILDDRAKKEAELGLMDAKDRVSQYNAQALSFENMKNEYDAAIASGYSMATDVPSDDMTVLKQIHQVESGGSNPLKENASGYVGMYQQRYRPGDIGYIWAKKNNVSKEQILSSPALQNRMMVDQLKGYKNYFAKKGIKSTPYTLFLAHNQGLGGASGVLSGKLTPTIRRNLANQGIGAKPGDSDYILIQKYHNKFRKRFS